MPNIGPMEIAVVVVLILIVFGPKRLPELGRSLGKGMREFKQSITGTNDGSDETPQPALKAEQTSEPLGVPASNADTEAPRSDITDQ